MSFTLPKLEYSYEALEPFIDTQTMTIHHTKHHQAYIDNLNKALADLPELAKMSVENLLGNISQVPEGVKQAVINSAGGHANHSFFWQVMGSNKKVAHKPETELAKAIASTFDSFANFKDQFRAKAMGVFGSGWAFLIKTPDGKLMLKGHSFQNSPLTQGNTPILGIDVWEHAYYLKYQNRRAEYIDAWWNVVNWSQVEKNFLTSQ